MPDMATNLLYYGDNLDVLKRHIQDESVDLIYLDPPFNSNQSYNVLFADQDGTQAAAQVKAFEDTWHWVEAIEAYQELVEQGSRVSEAMQAFRRLVGENDMLAYLAMMAPRLVELHRILKPTGVIYLHCDSTASHYLKVLMDSIWGVKNFRNEIIWQRVHTVKGNFGQGSKFFPPNIDTLLFYSKTDEYCFQPIFGEYSKEYINRYYRYKDSDGRKYRLMSMIGPGGAAKGNPKYEFLGVTRYWRYSRKKMQEYYDAGMIVHKEASAVPVRKLYLDQGKGVAIQSLWTDIEPLNASSAERLGYPTQKPEKLLERIVSASSNEGDIVLDPFCGCGTTISVAQKLKRKWIGIDITHLAITLIKHRLEGTHGKDLDVEVIGEPTTLPGAKELAKKDPYQFQWWSLGLVGARPTEQKKGADKGIDGKLFFFDEQKGKAKSIIFSVKAGKVSVAHIRDLRGVIERENAAIGVFITMSPSTKPMRVEAASAGFYDSPGWNKKYPRIQILTIEELLDGRGIDSPPQRMAFKQAPKRKKKSEQGDLGV